MGPTGESPRSISFHETHEWDPCLLNDGRVAYTRWDYVDRNAVHYQQLWSARPDGGNVRIVYGNNTWNPAGLWEVRPVPGSPRIMATASPPLTKRKIFSSTSAGIEVSVRSCTSCP